ncbi:MAG: GAF domain-containing protein [Pseudonocardia sp.]
MLCPDQLLGELTARTRQQAEIVALGQAALAGVAVTTLFERVVRLLVDVLPVEYAKVLCLRPDRTLELRAGIGWRAGLVGSAVIEADYRSQAGYTLLSDTSVVVDDLESETRFWPNGLLRDHGITSGMSVVIRGAHGPFGILGVHSANPRRFSVDDVNCLRAAAHVLSEAIRREAAENSLRDVMGRERTLREELERYSVQLREAHEIERHRIARELHDEVGQILTALKLMLERMDLPDPDPTITGEAKLLVSDLMTRIHDLCLDLRPLVLDDFGLVPALIWLVGRFEQQTGIRVEFHHYGLANRPSHEIELGIYRLIQEALTNIARHAHVDRCSVRCTCTGEELHVAVRDNGVGFAVCRRDAGGLRGIEERVRELGGHFEVRSAPGRGVHVEANLPLEQTR